MHKIVGNKNAQDCRVINAQDCQVNKWTRGSWSQACLLTPETCHPTPLKNKRKVTCSYGASRQWIP